MAAERHQDQVAELRRRIKAVAPNRRGGTPDRKRGRNGTMASIYDADGVFRGYSISSARAEAVARTTDGRLTAERVAEICLYDWCEGQDHQDWLDTAPVEEIAIWAGQIARDEDAFAFQAS